MVNGVCIGPWLQVQRPMVLVGTSLGCAVATHFARQHPEAVARLVFAGPQVYVDGIGPMASMPRPLAYLGVQVRTCLGAAGAECFLHVCAVKECQAQELGLCQVLRSVPLRSLANRMAYYDAGKLATQDAMRIGRLHTHMPGACWHHPLLPPQGPRAVRRHCA